MLQTTCKLSFSRMCIAPKGRVSSSPGLSQQTLLGERPGWTRGWVNRDVF